MRSPRDPIDSQAAVTVAETLTALSPRSVRARVDGDVEITVSTSPAGLTLAKDIKLLKPALLYADHVTLYSPTAALLSSGRAVGAMGEVGAIELLRAVGPQIQPRSVEALELYEQLRCLARPSKGQRRAIREMKQLLLDCAAEVAEKMHGLSAAAGITELQPALDAGLVTIDPLVRERDGGDGALERAYLERLRMLLRSGHAYPLFDDVTGDLVRAALADGVWELGTTPRRRGKQVAAAAQLMDSLPTFPQASMSEVLDVRDSLRSPLRNFRAAVIQMERDIAAAAHEPDFTGEVEELYLEKVAPALEEIHEAIRSDRYLRALMEAGVADAHTYTTGVLAVAVALFTHIPHLAVAGTGLATSAVSAAAKAAWKRSEGKREAERHQLFFLYRLRERLRQPS